MTSFSWELRNYFNFVTSIVVFYSICLNCSFYFTFSFRAASIFTTSISSSFTFCWNKIIYLTFSERSLSFSSIIWAFCSIILSFWSELSAFILTDAMESSASWSFSLSYEIYWCWRVKIWSYSSFFLTRISECSSTLLLKSLT